MLNEMLLLSIFSVCPIASYTLRSICPSKSSMQINQCSQPTVVPLHDLGNYFLFLLPLNHEAWETENIITLEFTSKLYRPQTSACISEGEIPTANKAWICAWHSFET